MKPKLRLATLDDIPALGELMARSVRGLGPRFYTPEETEAAARYITVPDPQIIGDGTYYVVEMEERIVGCGGWSRRRKLFTGAAAQEDLSSDALDPLVDAAKVRAMFVDPSWARQGIGELIYQECEKAAYKAGFRKLELMGTLPGVPFYKRMGFIEEEPENMQLPDGTLLPGIRMYKFLPSSVDET
jgi:GNAT superfamily N-acetyltransferase